MSRRLAFILAALIVGACGRTNTPPAADSTAIARRTDDSIIALRTHSAPALADTARSTLATLLKHPASALFDSVVVVQPPKEDGSWPMPYVCGRIGGKPGIGGRNTMTPFIYRNRLTVFVRDQSNGAAFAALRAKDCDDPASRLLLK